MPNSNHPEKKYATQLGSRKVFADRKIFFIDAMVNDRGKFIKFTEDVGGRRDTILIPEEFLEEVLTAFEELIEDHFLPFSETDECPI